MGRVRDLKGLNMVFAYTFVRSEFKGTDGQLYSNGLGQQTPLQRDGNKEASGKHGMLGFRWRYVGGAPYTPYDIEKSSFIEAWDANGQGYLDYTKYQHPEAEGL